MLKCASDVMTKKLQ